MQNERRISTKRSRASKDVVLRADAGQKSLPTDSETVVTHPAILGLEIHIPAGTVLRDRAGKIVSEFAIVPLPVDRSPVPVPQNFLAYFSMQPGGASIEGL